MAERNGEAVTFRNWDGGEYGIMDPGLAGRAEKQMFTGTNVMRYRTGLIGPRPGLKALSFTSPPTGTPMGGGAFLETGDDKFWALLKTGASSYAVHEFATSAETVSSAYSGTLPSTVSFNLAPGGGSGTVTYINVAGAGVYKLNHATDAASLIDTDPQGNVIGIYGVRLLANNGDTIWYSDAADFDTFGATSYVEVAGFSNSFYAPFRDGIVIGTSGGIFHILTGVLGATTTIRELSRGGGPPTPFHAVRVADDKIWYWNSDYLYPSMFNGAIHERYDWLSFPNPDGDTFWEGAYPSRQMVASSWVGTNDWVTYGFGSPNTCVFQHDVMSKHDLALPYAPAAAFEFLGKTHVLLCPEDDTLDTADTMKAYYFSPGYRDRPAFTSDPYGRPGDESDTPLDASFTTPEWWEDKGHEIRVNQVIVDYEAWNSGSTGNAGFDVQVDMLHRARADGVTTGTSLTGLDASQAGLSTSGTTGRAVVNVDGTYGGGFQITIDNIKSCAIRSVTAVLSPSTRRA